VTVQGITYPMDRHFSSWPRKIHRAGRHVPLPEAQLDRFMFTSSSSTSRRRRTAGRAGDDHGQGAELSRAVTGDDILEFQKLVRRVPIPESVARYTVSLVRAAGPPRKARTTSSGSG